ncbi:MAG: hypothetical protein PHP53_04540 [Prolixibacteraceae bacterium]|nr:hypothetical protein [Prolixibacteraceae bacterium]
MKRYKKMAQRFHLNPDLFAWIQKIDWMLKVGSERHLNREIIRIDKIRTDQHDPNA